MANNFGVPQELLDFLKQKITDKEAEQKKIEVQLTESQRRADSLADQLQNFENVSNQKLQEARDEQNRLITVGMERDKKHRLELKSVEEDFQQKLSQEIEKST